MDKYVKPKYKGLIVRYPNNMVALPETGGWVPMIGRDGRYWRRRLYIDKMVVECQPPKKVVTKIEKKGGHK